MNITNRLYTYPILSLEKNDYIASIFEVEFCHSMSGVSNLLLQFNINMNNAEINQLIRNGKAEYVIHLECSTTAYRTSLHSSITQIEHDIPISQVNGKLEIVAFIISKSQISGFSSKDLVDDFEGLHFDFAKASVLGYQNLPALDITKDYEELANASSIFLVCKKLTEEAKPMDVDLESSRIKIGLSSDEYGVYSKFCPKVEFQPILNAMVILPALVYVFEELKQEGGIEANQDREWFVSLDRAYKKRGICFINEINDEDKSSIQLAQEAMELPLNSAFSKLADLYENDNEEET
ncbi:MAG: hypothetical protein JJE17_01635 [Peptostreptococcaceae bacterium]|nr:hypothetical protein [Peptostreptococcaceae bacterium]